MVHPWDRQVLRLDHRQCDDRDVPEGVGFFNRAQITVVGRNGGTFPIGGGPAGSGHLVYDGFIYTVDDDGVPWATEGDPIAMAGNFTSTTERICAALA